MIRDTLGEESGGSGSCTPALVTSPDVLFPSMSGQPLIAHGVTGEGVTTVRLETTNGNVDVNVTSLDSLGIPTGAFAVAVPPGAEVRSFVALDDDGNEIGRVVGPAAPAQD